SYVLTPTKPGWSFDPPSRTVTLTEGQTLTAEFAAAAASGSLIGLVLGRNGQALAGAQVTLSPGDQVASTGSMSSNASSPSGSATTSSTAAPASSPSPRAARLIPTPT